MPLRLVLRNLLKHKLRALLTAGSLAIALFLLCVLTSLVVALEAGVKNAAVDRLIVQSSVSLFVYMPESYEPKLREVEGIENVCRWNWFGGYYQDPSNFFAQFATDPASFLDMYPEVEIVEGSREEFERERTACIVGVDTARRFDFKVGDTVPIVGALFPRQDGEPWTFKVAAIYRPLRSNVDGATLYFHYLYMQKALESGEASGPEGVGIYVIKLSPGADRTAVAARVDELFENGPQKTQTVTEAEFQAQFVSMFGNVPFFVGSIGGGVTIAILLAALNTMLMAAREQTRDVGVLKALGFGDGTVFGILLLQSMVLCGIGGFAGVALAKAMSPIMSAGLGTYFPGYAVTDATVLQGLALTLVIGLFAGLAPAWRARSLPVIQALRTTA
jgi:putative ABC transport system permease protein